MNRAKDQQKATQQQPEDFMDDEDLAEVAEAKKLQTMDSFSGIGSTSDDSLRRDTLVNLMHPKGTSIGAKLLQKMGWREGQGVGPKIRRKARMEEEDALQENGQIEHLFAPENTKMISFVRKTDFKGLGFSSEALVPSGNGQAKENEDDDNAILSRSRLRVINEQKKPNKKSGFGVGILNDNGSDDDDDDDPFTMGPKITYNRTIGPPKKSKKLGIAKSIKSSHPLLAANPVFLSKKKLTAGFRKCHDGRLPLDGFVLSLHALDLSKGNSHPPPKVPDGWRSVKTHSESTPALSARFQSTSDAAKGSTLDPNTRASLLGEVALPGKSVFDYLNSAARSRLVAASGREDLPAARGEAPPEAYRKSDVEKHKQLWAKVPELDKHLALGALNRGQSGWMPYSEDVGKRARYRAFLELRAGLRDVMPERVPGVSVDDWTRELNEFSQAAQVFRPMTGMMASRFTTSSNTFEINPRECQENDSALIRMPTAKPDDPAESAAKIGMYGPMTHSVHNFLPTQLVCKRFGVKPPKHIDLDPGSSVGEETTAAASVSETVNQSVMDQIMREAAARQPASIPRDHLGRGGDGSLEGGSIETPAVVDVETNEALEQERPGDAVFNAIFGSDDEDSD
jgi:G patch domain-containing protein 1